MQLDPFLMLPTQEELDDGGDEGGLLDGGDFGALVGVFWGVDGGFELDVGGLLTEAAAVDPEEVYQLGPAAVNGEPSLTDEMYLQLTDCPL